MTETVKLSDCPNCGAALDGRYCARCGQKAAPINPSLHDLLHDLTHELLHVDGKIFRSVQLLLTRPGFLSREYFHARRARYISPIRLYLIFSVLFFGLSTLGGDRAVFEADEEIEVGALGRALGLGEMSPAEANELTTEAQTHWVPRAMFLLVPICALLVQAATRRSGRHYPQHLYFTLHCHAAYFAVRSVTTTLNLLSTGFLSAVLSALGTVFLVGYSLVAFRTAYGGSWRLAAGRTFLVLTAYMIVVGFALIAVVVAVLRV